MQASNRQHTSTGSRVTQEIKPAVTRKSVEPLETAKMEGALERMARLEVRKVAAVYLASDRVALRGISEYGAQLLSEVGPSSGGTDFRGLVSHNAAFWLAERELAPGDVSLPYLVAMLAILSRDYTIASQCLGLAQATLPLTPGLRRSYARPEAMLLVRDRIMVDGLPLAARLSTVEQCEEGVATVRKRISHFSCQPVLVRALIALEMRRAQIVTLNGLERELMHQNISVRLHLSADDLSFVRQQDPILATGLEATVREWVEGRTLAQRWTRWLEQNEPAESAEVEASIAAYVANDRYDLAWLAWRGELMLQGVVSPHGLQRWKPWCDQLLDRKSAAYVKGRVMANPRAGRGFMSITLEGPGEGWSGDQRVHPLIAIKTEREIAQIDVMLSLMPSGTPYEAKYRLMRAHSLTDIVAAKGARLEVDRARSIIGEQDEVKIAEAQVLRAEGHYADAIARYADLLRQPAHRSLRVPYGGCLLMAGE